MWLKNRLRRLQSRWKHLITYYQTLGQANEIERKTDFTQCRHPVLLLYGFGATRRSLSILEARLRQDGFGVFSLNLGGFLDLFNTDPIDRLAEHIAQKVEILCRRFSFERIAVIGYSKGGLIGRYYVSRLGGEKRVHTLITLATPHQGNPWVWLTLPVLVGLWSRGLRQMLPGSPFLKRLNETPFPPSVYLASIASLTDRYCPPRYSQLPSGTILLNGLRHSDFVIKQGAYQEILKHLQAGFRACDKMSDLLR